MYECFKITGLNKLQDKILPLEDAAELLGFFWITEVVLGVVLVLIGLLGLFWVLEDIFGSARLGDSTFVSFGFLAPQPQCLLSHEQVSILPSFDTKHICNKIMIFFKSFHLYILSYKFFIAKKLVWIVVKAYSFILHWWETRAPINHTGRQFANFCPC